MEDEEHWCVQQNFGKNMRNRRKKLGYTLSDLALLTNVDRTHLNLIELGKRNTTLGTAQKIATSLKTTVVALLG